MARNAFTTSFDGMVWDDGYALRDTPCKGHRHVWFRMIRRTKLGLLFVALVGIAFLSFALFGEGGLKAMLVIIALNLLWVVISLRFPKLRR